MTGSTEAPVFDSAVPPAGRWYSRILDMLMRRRAFAGSLSTLALKVGGTGFMMGIFLVAARSMSPQGFGELAISFNALSFLAVLAVFGQDVLVVRCWGEYVGTGAHGLALGAYRFGWTVVIGTAIGFGMLTLGVGTLNPYYPIPPSEAAAGAAFVTMQVLLLFAAQTTRVVVNFLVSEFNRELTWRLVLLPVVLASPWIGLTPTIFYTTAAAGLALAVALQLLALYRFFPESVRTASPEMRRREWVRRATSMWTSAVFEAAAQYAEVLLLGVLVSPAVAGLYFVAARIANIFSMMSSGLHSYTVTHSARLYYSDRLPMLQSIFRSVMIVMATLSSILLFVILLAGDVLLKTFGKNYVDGYPVLLLLSMGSYVAAMAGPSSGLLLVTGHELLYSRVLFVALLIRVGLISWAAPRFGAIAVAGAWTLVNGPVAVGLAVATRRLTGIDPSVLSVITHRSSRIPATSSTLRALTKQR